MDPINESYQKAISEAKSDATLKQLQNALKYAEMDRKEFDGYDVDNYGKKTLAYKWQIELGDKKIAKLKEAIAAYEEYLKANAEWSKRGAV